MTRIISLIRCCCSGKFSSDIFWKIHLHDTSTFAVFGEGEELVGQSDHLAEPVENDGLQFSASRAGSL